MVKIRTTCGMEIWSGFFGIDANGTQPDCMEEIEIEVEEESIEREGDAVKLCYSIACPKCGGLIEWPQEWEVVE
jgi:hypothetical protein